MNIQNETKASCQETVQEFPSFTTRPISCQVLPIDTETADKLLREFFNETNKPPPVTTTTTDESDETLKRDVLSPKSDDWASEVEMIANLQKLTKLASDKAKNQKKKKTKFSNFRLFLSSGKSDKSSKTMRTRGLVNCLTSSASSSASSCEELRQYQKTLLKSKKQPSSPEAANTSSTEADELKRSEQDLADFKIELNKEQKEEDVRGLRRIEYTKSVFSINSRMSNYLCEMDDYNELRNLNNLCPLVVSDVDEELPPAGEERKKKEDDLNSGSGSKRGKRPGTTPRSGSRCNCVKNQFCSNNNVNSNNFNNNSIVTNHNNTTNVTNISSIISVPLNNYLFYNYERKEGNSSGRSSAGSGSSKKSEGGATDGLKQGKIRRPESTTSNETITTGKFLIVEILYHLEVIH